MTIKMSGASLNKVLYYRVTVLCIYTDVLDLLLDEERRSNSFNYYYLINTSKERLKRTVIILISLTPFA